MRAGDNESERERQCMCIERVKIKNALQMWENVEKDIFSRKTIKKMDHQ